MKFKNLLVSGCSFSQDGIGGVPPTEDSPGACSFIESTDYNVAVPGGWPSFLAKRLGITSLVNTAITNHSNILVANTLLECINRFKYSPDDTLVLLNIALATKFDLPCSHDHPDADHYTPWDKALIPYTFMSRDKTQPTLVRQVEENIGAECIEYMNANYIELLFNFLENKGFQYYFLTTTDYSNSYIKNVLDKFSSHAITLTPGDNIVDFCKATGYRKSERDFHASIAGHEEIANQVYQYLVKNEIYLPVL